MEANPPLPKHAVIARIAGIGFLVLACVCLYCFTLYDHSTLARFGFPKAWAGAPFLLGAGFLGISGAFLLVQRRFSLAGLLVGLIVSAAMTAAGQAYVNGKRETTVVRIEFDLPADKHQEFIKMSRELLPSGRLDEFARDALVDGWLNAGSDFDSVAVRIAADPAYKDAIITNLDFTYSTLTQPYQTGGRKIVSLYAELVHNWIMEKLNYPVTTSETHMKGSVYYELWIAGGGNRDDLIIYELAMYHPQNPTRHAHAMVYGADAPTRQKTLEWLHDHEPNAELKKHFEDMLK